MGMSVWRRFSCKMWVLSSFLHIRALIGNVPQNKFSAHSQFKLRSFVSSLNTSHLQTLSFTCNPTLSDAFVSTFLLNLSSPHLHALHLSAMDLSPLSTPVITSYLESRRSYPLRILKLNGNRIGFSGVRKIVRCIERSNFTLLSIELFANTSVEPQEEPSSSSSEGTSDEDRDGDGEDRASSSRLNEILRVCLARNKVLRDRTCRAAVELLPVARVLLLRSVRRSSGAFSSSLSSLSRSRSYNSSFNSRPSFNARTDRNIPIPLPPI
jgi:hypothetical protein